MKPDDDKWVSQFVELADRLNGNVLYRLSLTSKELFHSNFLSWLFDTYPELIQTVLRPHIPAKYDWPGHSESTRREYEDLDLVVFPQGKMPIVIENKVFSSFRKDQLAAYDEKLIHVQIGGTSEKIRVKDCQRVLLSLLVPSGELRDAPGWLHLRYDDIIERLRLGVHAIAKNSFNDELIERYLSLLTALIDLRDGVGRISDDEPLIMPTQQPKVPLDGRVRDFVGKARFTCALNELRNTYSSEKIHDHAAFSRGTPIVECFYELSSGHYLGWQYQSGLFKLAVVVDRKQRSFEGNRLARERLVLDTYPHWCQEDNLPESLDTGSGTPSMQKGPIVSKLDQKKYSRTGLPESGYWSFNSYEPDFVYRSVKVGRLTLGQLKLANRVLMERAAALDRAY